MIQKLSKWYDRVYCNHEGKVVIALTILAFSLFFGIIFGMQACSDHFATKRPSTGTVIGKTQTFDKHGNPEYYIYIQDDVTGVVDTKSIYGAYYFTLPEKSKVSYVVYGESDFRNIKVIWKSSSESL